MPLTAVGGGQRALTPKTAMSKRGGDSVEQHIEFGDGSAASAALAEAFDYFMRIAEDFDPSEIRAAVVVVSIPGWASPRRKPPPLRSAAWRKWSRFRRTVKARVCRIGRMT